MFLRSPQGDDPGTALWAFDVAEQRERLVVDPGALIGAGGDESLSAEEQARRERARETAGGIVSYAIDRNARQAAVVLAGRLFIADLDRGGARELPVPAPVFDPRLDPTGRRVAFVHDRDLHVAELADGTSTKIAGDADPEISWGLAEFVAAEEMDRGRGYWWSPDGEALLATRVDESPVEELWIAAPADPATPPRPVRYPRAGTANARVEAHLIGLNPASATPIAWDEQQFPYLVRADWDDHGPTITLQTRDQRRIVTLAVDPKTGHTTPIADQSDPAWMDLVLGVPRRLGDGRTVTVGGAEDMPALLVDSQPVTPPSLEVRAVVDVADDQVVFVASPEPTQTHVYRWTPDEPLEQLTSEPGVHTAVASGGRQVIASASLDRPGTSWKCGEHTFASNAETPLVAPQPRMLTLGPRQLQAGLLLPHDHEPGNSLPVLLDPYGGPHFQRVVRSCNHWLESQWLANQGFAVLVADGRGTPGRGLAWARAVRQDLADPPLQDQIDALQAAGEAEPDLDLHRVAIRGWSFGGYLSALAVLRRPDVFHAAVAGAPVTDWRLYDTHYTERYLGADPAGTDAPAYERSSILGDAERLSRPLLLIHGLADDNVLVAHTLQLSQRLTHSGRLHSVLPLSGITHMTPQEEVAENLLNLQVDFLRQALGPAGPPQMQD